MDLLPYDRAQAVYYAHKWAYVRNPLFYNYDDIGGDCTNFASQCIYAGTGVMNYTPVFGWYYIDPNDKAPAWTGVEYLRNFLVRDSPSPGPAAIETEDLSLAQPGDVIQMLFAGDTYQHSTVVVATDGTGDPSTVWIAAHSFNVDCRPIDTYYYQKYRLLHILGYYA